MMHYFFYISDCNSPFSLTFVSNSEAVEAPAATAVQRGKFFVFLKLSVRLTLF